jgi:hypothetical protein
MTTVLPAEFLRHVRAEDMFVLLEHKILPDEVLAWLHEVTSVLYSLSLQSGDERFEVATAEKIQDSTEQILRRFFLILNPYLPPPAGSNPAASDES